MNMMTTATSPAVSPHEVPLSGRRFFARRRELDQPSQQRREDSLTVQSWNETAWQLEETDISWKTNAHVNQQETKTTREILDTIDTDVLRAAQANGRTMPQIAINRDQIARLLGLRNEWKRPDEIYADEAWEICIIWRSEYGRVEIGTEEDGNIGYYVSRTLSDKNEEGHFLEHSKPEINRIMSWLEEALKEI